MMPCNSNVPSDSFKRFFTGRRMGLNLFNDSQRRRVYLNLDERSTRRNAPVFDHFNNVEFFHTNNVSQEVLRAENLEADMLMAIDGSNEIPTLYYTIKEKHVAPIALNLLSNIYAGINKPIGGDMPITTYNHPIKANKVIKVKSEEMTAMWVAVVVILYLASVSSEIVLPCRERINGSRHHHIMSGCPTWLYWAVTWVYDLIIPFFILIPAIALIAYFFERDQSTNRSDFLVPMSIILMLGVMSYLCMSYLISLSVTEINGQLVLAVIMFMFVILISPVTFEIRYYANIAATITHTLSHIFAPYTISIALKRAVESARYNSFCELNRHLCPDIPKVYDYFNTDYCCETTSAPYDYYGFTHFHYSITIDLIILIIQIIIYSILLILAELGIIPNAWHRLVNMKYQAPPRKFRNELAVLEAEYCKKNFDNPPPQIEMMAKNLHKKHWQILHKPVFAVRGVNFAIKRGECFGILGANGSGKSSTFTMMTAVMPTTRGQLYADKSYIHKNRKQYLYAISYCPQFRGADPFLSGADNMRLILTMRGLHSNDIESEVKTWLECVGLQTHQNRLVKNYSTGCARRLAAVMAFSSDASISLLDEPTTGVDSASRRGVWRAIRRALAYNRAIIITSHSMDEVEALCHRIAIMSDGEICTLGTSQQLRERHAVGYTLTIKLKTINERADFAATESIESLTAMKHKLHSQFQNLELKESHKTLLHYHIGDAVPYSDLFRFLEQLKESHYEIMEEYSVTETTLEQVFLSFGKTSQQKKEMAMKRIVEREKQKSMLTKREH